MKVGLDRKVLSALRDNYMEYEAYEMHIKGQVSKILNELVEALSLQEGSFPTTDKG